jgi:hypothetical protein
VYEIIKQFITAHTNKREDSMVDLSNKNLTAEGFSVVQMTEVYKENEEGVRTSSVGFFKDDKIAAGFVGIQADFHYYKTKLAHVLTNGKIGLEINIYGIKILDDKAAALEIRKVALSKLSKAEIEILGLDQVTS